MKEIFYNGGKLMNTNSNLPAEEIEKGLEFLTDFLIRPNDRWNTKLIRGYIERNFHEFHNENSYL